MGILCKQKAKVILPFAGNVRLIDFTLSNCMYSELKEIAVLTDCQPSALALYLRRWLSINRSSVNISALEPKEGSYLGTADAVYQNVEYMQNHGDDLVLILAGDHIYKMDYRRMLAFHRQAEADVTVAVSRVPIGQAHRFGTVTKDANDRIVDFAEKPEVPESNVVSMGVYIFNKQLLIDRLTEDARLPNSPHDFGHIILPQMVKRHRVLAYEFDGYWRDTGNPQAYYDANMELVAPKLSFSLDGTRPVLTACGHLPEANSQQGYVQDSLISSGCTIRGRVVNSILSPGVWVEEEAEIRDSILMANSFISYHSVVDHCILDEGVNVGKFCCLGFEGSADPEGLTLTLVGEGVTIPSFTAVCRNCKILPHVGPDDFTAKVVVSNSVVSHKEARTSQTQGEVGIR
jgi:glucose-1-phosphate adenylyltransferase